MSGERRLLLDDSPGERRGVVLLDGRPERLLIERDGEPPRVRLGERFAGRVRALAPSRSQAFVDLGLEPAGVVGLSGREPLSEGQAVEVEVVAEARAGKGPRLRLIEPIASRAPGRLAEAAPLEIRLQAFAPDALVARGAEARAAADVAEQTALAVSHRLKGGLTLTIEPTRALTAVDVDRAELGGGSERRVLDDALRAIRHAARLLRLKAIGGAVVIDLAGFPGQNGLLIAEAERAFAPDGPGVRVLAPSRLGLMEVAKPHRERPLAETLLDGDGRLSVRSLARRLARELQQEGAADPGGRFVAVCAPDTALALQPLAAELGPRFAVRAEAGRDRLDAHIRPA